MHGSLGKPRKSFSRPFQVKTQSTMIIGLSPGTRDEDADKAIASANNLEHLVPNLDRVRTGANSQNSPLHMLLTAAKFWASLFGIWVFESLGFGDLLVRNNSPSRCHRAKFFELRATRPGCNGSYSTAGGGNAYPVPHDWVPKRQQRALSSLNAFLTLCETCHYWLSARRTPCRGAKEDGWKS